MRKTPTLSRKAILENNGEQRVTTKSHVPRNLHRVSVGTYVNFSYKYRPLLYAILSFPRSWFCYRKSWFHFHLELIITSVNYLCSVFLGVVLLFPRN